MPLTLNPIKECLCETIQGERFDVGDKLLCGLNIQKSKTAKQYVIELGKNLKELLMIQSCRFKGSIFTLKNEEERWTIPHALSLYKRRISYGLKEQFMM